MNTENTFQKGSIYLSEFPFPDLKSSKIRPVVVLYEEARFNAVTIMAISSMVKQKKGFHTILLSSEHRDFIKTGLKKESIIIPWRVTTIKKNRLFYRLGYLTQRYMNELDIMLLNKLKIGYETNKMENYISYGRQSMDDRDIFSVVKTLRSDYLTQGPRIKQFEELLAEYCGAKYAVAVSSGTAALHIACLAAGFGKGDILWTSPNTFVASANCALYCGAKPDFVDINSLTYNMDVDKLETKLIEASKTDTLPKVVIPVHFAGQSCEMERIYALSKEYNFKIIEDACHALGGSYKNKKIGSCEFSDMTVFSFHPVKTLTTGEGGMILTNNEELYEKLLLLRTHGITKTPEKFTNKRLAIGNSYITNPQAAIDNRQTASPWYYQQIDLGMNYRITDIQASLGISQLKRIDDFVSKRYELAQQYNKSLSGLPLILPYLHPDNYSAFHLYVVRLKLDKINKTRKEVFGFLREKGIGVNVHYIPVHIQPYYKKQGFEYGQYPEAEKYYEEALTIPLFPSITEKEQHKVIDSLREVLQ
jgi:UDP-4-amino-4,6-dideoxy-N-acetyl-beta-L-altrosamine transaminase